MVRQLIATFVFAACWRQTSSTDANDAFDSNADGLSLLQKTVQRRPTMEAVRKSGVPVKSVEGMIRRFHPKSKEVHGARLTSLNHGGEGACTLGAFKGCHTVCQRLKLSVKDGDGQCPLFENSLRACGYAPPHPLDCAVELLRASVTEEGMSTKVAELENCLDVLPIETNATCGVGIQLVKNEVADWKKETDLLSLVGKMREKLVKACVTAQAALTKKQDEEDALDGLVRVLFAAEKLPGYYLADESRAARDLLDKLSPIPLVKQALAEAMAEGAEALTLKTLPSIRSAITTLDLATQDGEHVQIPVEEQQILLQQLKHLEREVLVFKSACFRGNVSLALKKSPKDLKQSMDTILAAVAIARTANITEGMVGAAELVLNLSRTQATWRELQHATNHAEKTLAGKNKGIKVLDAGLSRLNASILTAKSLNLNRKQDGEDALEVRDRLLYVRQARLAIGHAMSRVQNVLENRSLDLSDNSEESAMQFLVPAIKWAGEVGLDNRLEPAKELAVQLQNVEEDKEQMNRALADGSASIEAKSGEATAVEDLIAALKTAGEVHVAAGVEDAKFQLDLLRARVSAKADMRHAEDLAREAFRLHRNERQALDPLNASIQEAIAVNLTEDAHVVQMQLESLLAALHTEHNLTHLLHKELPEPIINETVAHDKLPVVQFNRTGYEVRELPVVIGAEDDGDSDFQEHIHAIQTAIDTFKAGGFVDPDNEVQMAFEQNLEAAYTKQQEAVVAGERALASKQDTESAVVDLVEALKVSEDAKLTLGVDDARILLSKLGKIQPAMDELDSAMDQANVSLTTYIHMGAAQVRLNVALDVCSKLSITRRMYEGTMIRDRLASVKAVYVQMKAAIVEGHVALEREVGEEAAISELDAAVKAAKKVGMHLDLPEAVDLLVELVHMNNQHQTLGGAMRPR